MSLDFIRRQFTEAAERNEKDRLGEELRSLWSQIKRLEERIQRLEYKLESASSR